MNMSKKCSVPKIIVVVRGAKTDEEVLIERGKLVEMRQVTAESLRRSTIKSLNFMKLLRQIGVTSMLNRQFYAHLMSEFLHTLKEEIVTNYCFPYPQIETFKEAFSTIIDFAPMNAQDVSSLFHAANWIRFIVSDPFAIFTDSPKVKTSTVICASLLANDCDDQDDTKGLTNRKLKGFIYNHDVALHAGISQSLTMISFCEQNLTLKLCKKRKCEDVYVAPDADVALKRPKDTQICISPISVLADFNEIDWSPRPSCAGITGYMTPLSAAESMETRLNFDEELENDCSFKAMCAHIVDNNHAQGDVNLGGDIEPVPCWESLFTDFSISDAEQLLAY